jgi:hypothetical protein
LFNLSSAVLIAVSGGIFADSNSILDVTRADRQTTKGLLITSEAFLTFSPYFAEGSASGAFDGESSLISSMGYCFPKTFCSTRGDLTSLFWGIHEACFAEILAL